MKVENRKHPRVDVWIEVTFKSPMELVCSFMPNISKGGMFIQTSEPLALGTVLALAFQLPGQENLIRVKGKVVWNSPPGRGRKPGMGVQFNEMPEEDRHILEGFIQAQLAK
ncbi:MAG: TIGR02266 family protein [bacterium]|nr:TIGR02266 family protein [bacterium]